MNDEEYYAGLSDDEFMALPDEEKAIALQFRKALSEPFTVTPGAKAALSAQYEAPLGAIDPARTARDIRTESDLQADIAQSRGLQVADEIGLEAKNKLAEYDKLLSDIGEEPDFSGREAIGQVLMSALPVLLGAAIKGKKGAYAGGAAASDIYPEFIKSSQLRETKRQENKVKKAQQVGDTAEKLFAQKAQLVKPNPFLSYLASISKTEQGGAQAAASNQTKKDIVGSQIASKESIADKDREVKQFEANTRRGQLAQKIENDKAELEFLREQMKTVDASKRAALQNAVNIKEMDIAADEVKLERQQKFTREERVGTQDFKAGESQKQRDFGIAMQNDRQAYDDAKRQAEEKFKLQYLGAETVEKLKVAKDGLNNAKDLASFKNGLIPAAEVFRATNAAARDKVRLEQEMEIQKGNWEQKTLDRMQNQAQFEKTADLKALEIEYKKNKAERDRSDSAMKEGDLAEKLSEVGSIANQVKEAKALSAKLLTSKIPLGNYIRGTTGSPEEREAARALDALARRIAKMSETGVLSNQDNAIYQRLVGLSALDRGVDIQRKLDAALRMLTERAGSMARALQAKGAEDDAIRQLLR